MLVDIGIRRRRTTRTRRGSRIAAWRPQRRHRRGPRPRRRSSTTRRSRRPVRRSPGCVRRRSATTCWPSAVLRRPGSTRRRHRRRGTASGRRRATPSAPWRTGGTRTPPAGRTACRSIGAWELALGLIVVSVRRMGKTTATWGLGNTGPFGLVFRDRWSARTRTDTGPALPRPDHARRITAEKVASLLVTVMPHALQAEGRVVTAVMGCAMTRAPWPRLHDRATVRLRRRCVASRSERHEQRARQWRRSGLIAGRSWHVHRGYGGWRKEKTRPGEYARAGLQRDLLSTVGRSRR